MLRVRLRPQVPDSHRAIGVFSEALAQDQHERVIGVVFSGTASDGTLGLEAIKAQGGITFARDDSAQYQSIPHSAIAASCVDFVLCHNVLPKGSSGSQLVLPWPSGISIPPLTITRQQRMVARRHRPRAEASPRP